MALHENAPVGDIHRLHNWEFANTSARTSATYVAADVGKEAFQTDNSTFWRIISVSSGVATFREVAPFVTSFVTVGDIRTLLTANTTYYVRTDGSDSNNGLVNSSGGAFLTIQHAFNLLKTMDIAGYNLKIKVIDGDYTSEGILNVYLPISSGGNVTLEGNTSSLTAVSIKQLLCENQRNCELIIDAILFICGSLTAPALYLKNSTVKIKRTKYDIGGSEYIIRVEDNSILKITGDTVYSKNTTDVPSLFFALNNSMICYEPTSSSTLTLQNSPAPTLGVLSVALNNSFISLANMTISGAYTGSESYVAANSGSSYRAIDSSFHSS